MDGECSDDGPVRRWGDGWKRARDQVMRAHDDAMDGGWGDEGMDEWEMRGWTEDGP